MKSKWPQYYGALTKTEQRAKALRKDSTSAEKLLWKILRNREIKKLKFRRQHPIGHFILDFYCHELRLGIELDGDIHEIDFVKKHDNKRQAILRKLGITIIRFDNEIILSNPDSTLKEIQKLVEILVKKENARPHPDPLL
jgi:very-short-patch-repair endonuclease